MLWIQWFHLWSAVLRVFLAMAVVAATSTTISAVPDRQIDPTDQRLLTAYGRLGEQIVAIEPPLVDGSVVYRVYYFSTDSYAATDSSFFFRASTTFFGENGITGLLVTRDRVVIEDEALIRRVLTLYTAAHQLYRAIKVDELGGVPSDFNRDLLAVTHNPIFIALQVGALLKNREEQTAEALRGVLTHQSSQPVAVRQWTAAIRMRLEQGNNLSEAVNWTLEAARFSNDKRIREVAREVRNLFGRWQPITEQGTSYVDLGSGMQLELANTLDLLSLAIQLIWMAQLQQERAEWLALYKGTFPRSLGALDADQHGAASTVLVETEDAWTQRANIILRFARDRLAGGVLRLGSQELAKAWANWSWQEFGKRTTGHLVGGTASAVFLGGTLGNILYGVDDLFNNFRKAERANELRQRFSQGRRALERKVPAQPWDLYDANLAEQYRAAYMLESLAEAQALRSYADGVAATYRLPNPATLINWLRGENWAEAVAGLRNLADQGEFAAEETVGHPVFVDEAMVLVQDRLAQLELNVIGPESVWNMSPEAFAKLSNCIPNDYGACLISIMREDEASPNIISFSEHALESWGFLSEFNEIGAIDVGYVTYPFAANMNFGNAVLLNGIPEAILVNDRIIEGMQSGSIDIRTSPGYVMIVEQYPDVMIWPSASFETHEQVSSGGQRFIFSAPLVNGCHACEQVGRAYIAFDFDSNGRFVETELVSSSLSIEEARVTEDGNVYLGNTMLLDIQQEAPGCFEVGEISYSPTSEHFLVLLQCFEGDNEAFLFQADGSNQRRITADWDYINYNQFEWGLDGKYIIYNRTNDCCISSLPADAPQAGWVRYDVQTGIKTLLNTVEGQVPYTAPIIENGDGSYTLDGDPNCIERMLTETLASVVVWGSDASYCRGVTEGAYRGDILGKLQFASEIHYELNGNEIVLCDYENCVHANSHNINRIRGIVRAVCDFYVNRSRQTPSCIPETSPEQPTIIYNDRIACQNAKGTHPLVVSAVEDSPWCLIYPEGNWDGVKFDRFVLNGQVWTWVKSGCLYRLNDDSDDGELRVDYSPKVVSGVVGTVDYVIVSCN